jgi:hypothetical protein
MYDTLYNGALKIKTVSLIHFPKFISICMKTVYDFLALFLLSWQVYIDKYIHVHASQRILKNGSKT